MRIILKALIAVLPVAGVMASPASAASEPWRQSCAGAEYVCGSAKAAQATPKFASAVSKTKKVATASGKTVKKGGYASAQPKSKSTSGGSGGLSGMASWYGGNFHGRKTANGETYNQNALTAAHKTLPFGTRVRVTNTRSGSSVEVRINDRGPFVGGRIIDLSRAAAGQIGVTNSGVAPVKVTVLGKG